MTSFRAVFLALVVPLLLTACGGTQDSNSSAATTTTSSGSPSPDVSAPADTTAPTITIVAPTTGSTYNTTSASVTVTGSATDNVGLSQLSWTSSLGGSGSQSISGNSADGSFSIALVSGANVITLTARDTSGNTAQKQLTVNYVPAAPTPAPAPAPAPAPTPDTTPPTVSITAPTTGPTYTASSANVTVASSATDNVGLSQLSWSNSKGGSGSQSVSGTSASGSFSIALSSGSNVITVTARDSAGNTAQKQLTISYTPPDTTPPTVSITSPTTGSTYTASSANVTVASSATDNVGLSQLSWSNSKGGSGSQSVSGTSASGSFSIALSSGSNVITVTARDSAGNTAQKQLTISYTPTISNSATLAWDAVTATNLSGYRVYYGTAPGTYQQAAGQGISVGNVTTYTLMGLSSGTRYYFAVTAFDTQGNESGYSNETFKDIP
jgi:hypothetical protein